jgi:hypothetical protein
MWYDNVLKHENAYIILYADDLAIFTSTRDIEESMSLLTEEMLKLEDWSHSVGLYMNYTKTNFMIFHKIKDK